MKLLFKIYDIQKAKKLISELITKRHLLKINIISLNRGKLIDTGRVGMRVLYFATKVEILPAKMTIPLKSH